MEFSIRGGGGSTPFPVLYTHLRAHEPVLDLVCRLLLEKKKSTITTLFIRLLLATHHKTRSAISS